MKEWFSRRTFLGLMAMLGWGCGRAQQRSGEQGQGAVTGSPADKPGDGPAQEPETTREQVVRTPDDPSSVSTDEVEPSIGSAEWGDLQGQFVYDGDLPVRKLILITVDEAYCGKFKLRKEEIVVDPATKGVANVIVWLYRSRSDAAPPVHESYAKTEKAEVNLDSTHCRIDPHVSLLRTTQTLVLRNTDPIADGLKITSLKNKPLNVMIPIRGELLYSFRKPERLPVSVSCPVHGWESGWLLVQEHPYMAVSAADGKFEIKNLPAGEWTFQFWHEQSGYLRQVKRNGKQETWQRGRLEIDIKPGENDLGKVILAPALFERK